MKAFFKKYSAVIIGIALTGAVLTVTDSLCFFKAVFGIPCPGCGLTRSYISLLRLDIKSAFYYHPLFWVIPVIAAVIISKSRRLYSNKYFWLSIFVLFVGVYSVRMYLYFPDTPPMDYNENSLWYRTAEFIRSFFERK